MGSPGRILRWSVLVVVAALLGLAAPPAQAAVRVRWETTPACVDADSLPRRVDALLGPASDRPAIELTLAAERLDGGWRIRVVLPQQHQVRPIEGPDCDTLTDAVALIVAVHADAVATATAVSRPEPATRADVVSAPPVAPTLPPTQPAVPEPRESSTPPPPPRVAGALLSSGVAAELGILPRHAAAFFVEAGVAWRRVSIAAGGLASIGPAGRAPDRPELGARMALYGGTGRACALVSRRRFELPVCAALELGALRAAGEGVTEPRTVNALWLATTAGVRPGFRLGPRVAIYGLFDAVVPLRRHRFSIADDRVVHLVPAIATRIGVALHIHLPSSPTSRTR